MQFNTLHSMMSYRVLQKPWQFRHVYRNGKKIDCKYASLFYYRSGEPCGPQFGFVASRRLGGAVKRNRAKRLLREATAWPTGRLKHNDLWIVMIARSPIINTKSHAVRVEIWRKLSSAGLVVGETPT